MTKEFVIGAVTISTPYGNLPPRDLGFQVPEKSQETVLVSENEPQRLTDARLALNECINQLPDIPEGRISESWAARWDSDSRLYKGDSLRNILPREITKETTSISTALSTINKFGIITKQDLRDTSFSEQEFLSMKKIGPKNISFIMALRECVDAEFEGKQIATDFSEEKNEFPIDDDFERLHLSRTGLKLARILAQANMENSLTTRELAKKYNERYGTKYNLTSIASLFPRLRPLRQEGYYLLSVRVDRPGGKGYFLAKSSEDDGEENV